MGTLTVVALLDGPLGIRVADWLDDNEDIDVLADISNPDYLDVIVERQPDLILSAGFRHIVPDQFLEVPDLGAINLHTSYLPHARGANPNVWSIVDDHPTGVSIHYMTSQIDGGKIIARREIEVSQADNARDLYERLLDAEVELLAENWEAITSGDPETIENPSDDGSYHKMSDFDDLCELDRDEFVRVGDLIDRLRALTFPPFHNAYFEVNGDRYYVDVEITPENEVTELTSIKRR